MIRYNWDDIKKYTKEDIDLILDYLKNIYVLKGEMYNYVLGNPFASYIVNSKSIKSSYLLNIDDFIMNNEKASKSEQYVYLDLASRRDAFALYNSKGRIRYLHEWEVANDYDIEKLKVNRLLMLDDKKIYFILKKLSVTTSRNLVIGGRNIYSLDLQIL